MKKGLIMEGGAMLGMFTCGVIDVFMENNIVFDGAIGISAGAVFGCNIKSKQIGRAIRYNKKYCNDKRYCSMRSLIKTGNLYGEEFCYHELPQKLDLFDSETFKNNPMEFYVGATNIMTGKCVYHKCFDGKDNDIKWMQASASMPMVSRPVVVDGHLLLDGGISDSVPYEYMENLGYNRNVIILTKPDGYIRKRGLESYMARLALFKYPVAAKAMFNRCEMYNHQMEEIKDRENNKTSFVIRPPQALGISRTENDPSELERVYKLGRNEAERRLPELRSFLDDK
ncbi:MAG: patatin family protein [Lachnospiraceae bacterium]|nr:patatin family protein [Lachnospiraceae bacterium]